MTNKFMYIYIYIYIVYIEMTNEYYQKNKEKLRKEVRESYKNLSEEEKQKKGWVYEKLLFSTKEIIFKVLYFSISKNVFTCTK